MSIDIIALVIVPSHVIQHSGMFLFMGLGLVCLGIAAWLRSARASIKHLYFYGCLLLAASGIEALDSYFTGGWSGFYIHLAGAILYGVAGFLLVTFARNDARSTSLIVAMYFISAGIFNIIAPLTAELPDRAWHAAAGFITLMLGPVLLAYMSAKKTRLSEFQPIGIFIGIDLCVRGAATMYFALALRHL